MFRLRKSECYESFESEFFRGGGGGGGDFRVLLSNQFPCLELVKDCAMLSLQETSTADPETSTADPETSTADPVPT